MAPSPAPACTVSGLLSPGTCAYQSTVKDRGVWPNGTAKAATGPTGPPSPPWTSGDAGMIISRGAMAAISLAQWRDCVTCKDETGVGDFNSRWIRGCYGGGDVRIGECLWRYGIAPTRPDQKNDNETRREHLRMSNPDVVRFLEDLRNSSVTGARRGGCDAECAARFGAPLAMRVSDPSLFTELEMAYDHVKAMVGLLR